MPPGYKLVMVSEKLHQICGHAVDKLTSRFVCEFLLKLLHFILKLITVPVQTNVTKYVQVRSDQFVHRKAAIAY